MALGQNGRDQIHFFLDVLTLCESNGFIQLRLPLQELKVKLEGLWSKVVPTSDGCNSITPSHEPTPAVRPDCDISETIRASLTTGQVNEGVAEDVEGEREEGDEEEARGRQSDRERMGEEEEEDDGQLNWSYCTPEISWTSGDTDEGRNGDVNEEIQGLEEYGRGVYGERLQGDLGEVERGEGDLEEVWGGEGHLEEEEGREGDVEEVGGDESEVERWEGDSEEVEGGEGDVEEVGGDESEVERWEGDSEEVEGGEGDVEEVAREEIDLEGAVEPEEGSVVIDQDVDSSNLSITSVSESTAASDEFSPTIAQPNFDDISSSSVTPSAAESMTPSTSRDTLNASSHHMQQSETEASHTPISLNSSSCSNNTQPNLDSAISSITPSVAAFTTPPDTCTSETSDPHVQNITQEVSLHTPISLDSSTCSNITRLNFLSPTTPSATDYTTPPASHNTCTCTSESSGQHVQNTAQQVSSHTLISLDTPGMSSSVYYTASTHDVIRPGPQRATSSYVPASVSPLCLLPPSPHSGAREMMSDVIVLDSSDDEEADSKLEDLFSSMRLQSEKKKQTAVKIPSRKSLSVFIVSDSDVDSEEENAGALCDFQPPCGPLSCCTDPHTPLTPFAANFFTPFNPGRGLGHCVTAPPGVNRRPLTESNHSPYIPGVSMETRGCAATTTPSAHKTFSRNKKVMAQELFALFNRTVFGNELPMDTVLVWNSKLRTTAGYCRNSGSLNDRRAQIELSNKVIDSYERLKNTLIHEMCHAAVWLINGVKNGGHQAHWRAWALKANTVHPELEPITRCHNYSISYKYHYKCTRCDYKLGRHSKSVNLSTARCPYCRSPLDLEPRLNADGTPATTVKLNRYAQYVKENYAEVRGQTPQGGHKAVMQKLRERYHNSCRLPTLTIIVSTSAE